MLSHDDHSCQENTHFRWKTRSNLITFFQLCAKWYSFLHFCYYMLFSWHGYYGKNCNVFLYIYCNLLLYHRIDMKVSIPTVVVTPQMLSQLDCHVTCEMERRTWQNNSFKKGISRPYGWQDKMSNSNHENKDNDDDGI